MMEKDHLVILIIARMFYASNGLRGNRVKRMQQEGASNRTRKRSFKDQGGRSIAERKSLTS